MNNDYPKFTRFNQFQAIRKSNPKLYYSSGFQMAMHDLAEKYGAAFFESPSGSEQVAPMPREQKIEALKQALAAYESQEENNTND